MPSHGRLRDKSWDFRGEPTKQHAHCFHQYPARMMPNVAGRIIDEFAHGARMILDPYCGAGTSLVEANIRGISSVGFDINPLALLISRVKGNPPDLAEAKWHAEAYLAFISGEPPHLRGDAGQPPRFKNIGYWFKEETVRQLAAIRGFVSKIESERAREFFLVAFSETVREVSLAKNGEFKLYRKSQEQIDRFNPDAYGVMARKVQRNLSGLEAYLQMLPGGAEVKVFEFNTVSAPPTGVLNGRTVDAVVTSPPYGDARTTVAYGQFSRLSNQWLGFCEHNGVDTACMGGRRVPGFVETGIPQIDETVREISALDRNRALEVLSFYLDYARSIENVASAVKPGGVAVYVVGNRRVRGIEIPNDEATAALFERHGFEHEGTIVREIPSKRMPRSILLSDGSGETTNTMNHEYIVVCRKRG